MLFWLNTCRRPQSGVSKVGKISFHTCVLWDFLKMILISGKQRILALMHASGKYNAQNSSIFLGYEEKLHEFCKRSTNLNYRNHLWSLFNLLFGSN